MKIINICIDSKVKSENDCQDEQPCLVRAFFERESQKSPHRRSNHCMISCKCKRCNPYWL